MLARVEVEGLRFASSSLASIGCIRERLTREPVGAVTSARSGAELLPRGTSALFSSSSDTDPAIAASSDGMTAGRSTSVWSGGCEPAYAVAIGSRECQGHAPLAPTRRQGGPAACRHLARRPTGHRLQIAPAHAPACANPLQDRRASRAPCQCQRPQGQQPATRARSPQQWRGARTTAGARGQRRWSRTRPWPWRRPRKTSRGSQSR